MARVVCGARKSAFSLAAGVTKTLLQLQAPANQGVAWLRAKVSFEGVTSGDKPVLLQIVKQTDAGTGGGAVTETVIQSPKGSAPTPQATALAGIWGTTEPTTTDVVDEVYVHPQSGYEWVFQRGQDEVAYFNERYAIQAVTPASGYTACNVTVSLIWEE